MKKRETLSERNSPYRIWLINHYALSPDQSGGTRHHTLARMMHDQNIDMTLIASSVDYTSKKDVQLNHGEIMKINDEGGVRFVRLKTPIPYGNSMGRGLSMLSFAWAAVRLKPSKNLPYPDVIIGSSPHLFGAFAAWILSKRYAVPFVLEIRDIWPKSMISLLGVSPKHPGIRVFAWLEHFLYEHAVVIISLLQGVRQHAQSVTSKAAPVVWLPNGVLFSDYPAATTPDDNKAFTVMYTGAHGIPNSLNTALEAAHLINIQHPSAPRINFIFIGEGVEKTNLQGQSKALGLDNVTFKPPVPKSQIPQLLAQADAFLLLFRNTPLYRDGLSPNKTFDYMAAGRPILMAVDSPFNPVAEAGAGLSIPPEDPQALADAILHLASLPLTERQAMGERGRSYVAENHDMRGLARKLANVLRVVAERRA